MGNPIYKPQQFDASTQMGKMYGTNPSRRERRQFNKYWNSDQRYIDEIAYNKAEHDKMFESANKARIEAGQRFDTEKDRIHTQLANRKIETPSVAPVAPKPAIKQSTDWNAVAQQNGFANMEAVRQWQAENGLVADGKFGENSRAKWNSLQQTPQLVSRQINDTNPVDTPSDIVATSNVSSPSITEDVFRSHKNFRNIYGAPKNHTITIEGKTYPIMASTGLLGNTWGLENDAVYAFDPDTGMIRQVREGILFGGPSAAGGGYKFASGSEWSNALSGMAAEEEWLKANPAPNKRGPLGGTHTQEYKDWFKKYQTAKAGWKKQGGTMNRINYFQQGGAAPQQDIKAQITALVQAAMQGDQKATQTVNQIMEAAKAGDPQATQLAQMISEIAKQMQGQATAAKWGAKLGYIRSLKYGNGGKTCPACKKGGIPESSDKAYIKSTKKVEEKACGGKAKKKYFGGLI